MDGRLRNNRVEEFSSTGEFKSHSAGVWRTAKRSRDVHLSCKAGIAGSGKGSSKHRGASPRKADVWVTDAENNRVEEFSSAGGYFNSSSRRAPPPFRSPNGRLDGHGDICVTEPTTGRSRSTRPHGNNWRRADLHQRLQPPARRRGRPAGNVWVVDNGNDRIESSPHLEFMRAVGWGVKDGEAKSRRAPRMQARDGGLRLRPVHEPIGLAIDGKNTLWVVDSGNNRVERFNLEGEYLTQFGSSGSGPGQLSAPQGITATNGALYVADTGNNRVERWASTVAPSSPLGPRNGAEAGGTQVTITGVGFTGASAVSFGEHRLGLRSALRHHDQGDRTAGTAPSTSRSRVQGARARRARRISSATRRAAVTAIAPRRRLRSRRHEGHDHWLRLRIGRDHRRLWQAQATGVEVISPTEAKATSPAGPPARSTSRSRRPAAQARRSPATSSPTSRRQPSPASSPTSARPPAARRSRSTARTSSASAA